MLPTITSVMSHLMPAAKKAAPQSEPQKKTPPGPTTELLLAWAVPKTNPRILIAYRPGTDPSNPLNLVTVNVRANHNFMLNMKVRASKVSETVFDLVGPLPRWRGRW